MKQQSIKFLMLLVGLLIITFGIHVFILDQLNLPLFDAKIILSYIINFTLAFIILFVVELTFKKNSAQAGFVFMAGSALKFLVFFLVFYPSYKEDGDINTVEFLAFFVPYAICLITEVIYLSKQLNNQST